MIAASLRKRRRLLKWEIIKIIKVYVKYHMTFFEERLDVWKHIITTNTIGFDSFLDINRPGESATHSAITITCTVYIYDTSLVWHVSNTTSSSSRTAAHFKITMGQSCTLLPLVSSWLYMYAEKYNIFCVHNNYYTIQSSFYLSLPTSLPQVVTVHVSQ